MDGTRADLNEPLIEPVVQTATSAAAEDDEDAPPPWLLHQLVKVNTFRYDGSELAPFAQSFPLPDEAGAEGEALPVQEPERQPSVHLAQQSLERPVQSTFVATTLNVTKVILGSGMLVLPRAFQLVGCGLGILALAVVGGLTHFTIGGLVHASERLGRDSYAGVVRLCLGRPAKWGVLMAVFLNCLGMCIVFLVIYGDVLVGLPPAYSGVIRELIPSLPADTWVLDRSFVLAVVTLGVLLPLTVQQDLSSLGPLALMGVSSIAAFALSVTYLAGASLYTGTAAALPWWPDWENLGSNGWQIAASMLGVVPLLLNSDICHQSIFPAMGLLKPYSRRSFMTVIGLALTLCNVLYVVIAMGSLAAFGERLDANVLNNMSATEMAPLLGTWPATCVAVGVRLGYFVSLVGNFVFTFHPLRYCCLEMLLGSNFSAKPHKQAKADMLFLPLTLGLLALIYFIAVLVPSIWMVLSLVGSAASTFMGFIFPAAVILVMQRRPRWTHTLKRCVAGVAIALGVALFVNGFLVFFV